MLQFRFTWKTFKREPFVHVVFASVWLFLALSAYSIYREVHKDASLKIVPYVDPTPWEDSRSREPGKRQTLSVKGVDYPFRWIPAGSFMMGSPLDEKERYKDEDLHRVNISRGFWALETEVTQEMWTSAMGANDNPSRFKGSKRLPVDDVSKYECLKYIEKLNASGVHPEGFEFALPTEAQWEYACRAGTTTPFSFGDSLNGDKANCDGDVITYPYGTTEKGTDLGKATEVGSYAPNPWGLYDMHGNAREWVSDWYEEYPENEVTDPIGGHEGEPEIYRGGGWNDFPSSCRAASRHYDEFHIYDGFCGYEGSAGFRLVLVPTSRQYPPKQ